MTFTDETSNNMKAQLSSDSLRAGHLESQDSPGTTQVLDDETDAARSRFSVIIEEFSFFWFTVSMNTGILSILIHQLPYTFQGQHALSSILFVFNLVQFLTFLGCFVLRVVWYPGKLAESLKTNLTECALAGCVPIAFSTVVAQIALTCSQASWGGRSWMLVGYVLWWLNTFITVSFAVVFLLLVSKADVTTAAKMTPVMVIPFVGSATDAVVGAVVVNYSQDMTAGLAVPVIVVSYMLTGLGLFCAMMVYSVFFGRLLDHGFPPSAMSPGLFIMAAPPSQCAAALLLLGAASQRYFGEYSKGSTLTEFGGAVFAQTAVLWGFMLLGFGVFFQIMILYVVVEAAAKKQHKYSLVWWSTIFPNATTATAWIALTQYMDSPVFRVLSVIYWLILTVAYVVNWFFTIWYIWQGKLLSGKQSNCAPTPDRRKEH